MVPYVVLWHHICYIVKHNVSYNLVWTNPVFVNVSSVYIESLKKTFIQFFKIFYIIFKSTSL